MKVIIVLVGVFVLTLVISKLTTGNWNLITSGNIAMCAMLCLTALGHFLFTKGMIMMIPEFIPLKKELVYFTGIAEAVLGLALIFPKYRYVAGIVIIVLLILMFPANIYQAIKHVDLQKANYEGTGLRYLWFRIPMQVFFTVWVWYFSIRN